MLKCKLYICKCKQGVVILKAKRCFFAGHSRISEKESVMKRLREVATELIEKENVTEFWVGNRGDFDLSSASVIRELKELYPHINLELIIPYLTQEIITNKVRYNGRYDSIFLADIPETTPRRFRILKANQYMADNSNFLICYINYTFGGAVKTAEYAKRKKHIKVINLGELEL